MGLGLEIVIVLLLIVVNGLFSMSELALVSVRRARLAVLERKGVPAPPRRASCRRTRTLSCRPCRSASRWSAMLTGVFGGARIAGDVKAWLAEISRRWRQRLKRCRSRWWWW